jgi:hypothetical protein
MLSILSKENLITEKLSGIEKKKSISPSEIVSFEECPYKWKLTYLDRVSKFETNINFLFGKAAHDVIQEAFLKKDISLVKKFFSAFSDYIEKERANLKQADFDKIDELVLDAHNIFDNFDLSEHIDINEVEDVFVEEKMVERINDKWLFSGRLDLVFKIENKIKIWDIKTSKTAWKVDKKGNIAILSQPILYKHFWAKKHSFENLRDISTAFLILKKKSNDPIELFPVSSGPKAIGRCINNLNHFITMIEKEKFYKSYSKYSCKWCEYNNTEHCIGDKSTY